MTHDIGEPEGLHPLTGPSTFPTELEKHMNHAEHSLATAPEPPPRECRPRDAENLAA